MLSDLGLLDALTNDDRVLKNLYNLPGEIKPREDRYTILNTKNINEDLIRGAIMLLKKTKNSSFNKKVLI